MGWVFVGVDDTDSPEGGCTTHFALEAAAAFRREHGLVLRGRPRLVRLNPNVPWKTRGNAAVSLEFGAPAGRGGAQGGVAHDGTEILVDGAATPATASADHAATLDALIEKWCDLEEPGTDPAYVIGDERPPETLYERAVQGVVDPEDVREELWKMPSPPIWKALGDGRGIVGAAAAAAYPARGATFEITVYREQTKWGKPRAVDLASVDAMDRAFPTTFNNIDRANKHASVAPATPCPVLFGVRATAPDPLREAAALVNAGEPWGGWLVFETNQGTDAHVVNTTVEDARPLETASVEGVVASAPRARRGGHVLFDLAGAGGGAIACAAFEPTKQFRTVVGSLVVGDRVRAVGAVRERPRTLNLEKLEVISLAPRQGRRAGERCAACGGVMKSAGRGGPLRCARCGLKAPRFPPPSVSANVRAGWYEVPVSARRHLSKPIDPHGGGAGAPAPGET